MTHEHLVIDDDPILIIDPASRTVTNQNGFPKKILQGDHNCERLTFQIPHYIEGHDMTLCNLVRVHFVNIGEENRIYGVEDLTDLHINEKDEETVLCSWLISGKATRLVGPLNFTIQFACVNDNLITYSWSTIIYTNLSVTISMDNTNVDDDYNKTINDVPFTVDDKNKLVKLPTNSELEEMFDERLSKPIADISLLQNDMESKVSIIRYTIEDNTPFYETDLWRRNGQSNVEYILIDCLEVPDLLDSILIISQIYRMTYWFDYWNHSMYYELEECLTGIVRTISYQIGYEDEAMWVISHDPSKLKELPTNAELNERWETEQEYMKDYVAQELATFDFIKVVDELPEEGLENRIYFVPKTDTQTQDLFDEYAWINGTWEWITTKQVEIDLTDYVPKSAFTYDATTETLTIDM